MFSVDIANLYDNIPTCDAIEATLQLLSNYSMTCQDIEALLSHCLNNNYVRFGDKYFKQTTSVAMGLSIAPPLAIIFMSAIESLILTSSAQYQPVAYMRYIDDVLGVWTHGAEKLDEYFQFLNNFHPALRFSIERTDKTAGGQIPFLDTVITVHDDGVYNTELYVKPMAAPIIVHYNSAHPMQCKRSVLYSQLLRAKRLGSDKAAQKRGMSIIETLFRHNGYPNKIIQRTKHRVLFSDQKNCRNTEKRKMTYITLPYIDESLARRVNGVIKGSGLNARVAWNSGKTLAQHLIRSASQTPPCPAGARKCHTCEAGLPGRCHTKNVVYKIKCNMCDDNPAIYIGETKRRVRERFNEHLRDAKNKIEDTPLGDHVSYVHPTSTIDDKKFKVSIEKTCKDVPNLKIAESIEIRNQRPQLNTQTSSWPLLYPPPY